MNISDGGWEPGFPPVMRLIDLNNGSEKPWKLLQAHPDYEAAKNKEDRFAALRLVQDFIIRPENQAQIKALKQKYTGTIIIPIRAIEAGGKNRIPETLAEVIGQITGFEVDYNIVQTNRVHRTGTDEWHRFAFRPAFDGKVNTGKNYILVDDVFALGGSLNELRMFVERNGGKVVQAVAMTTGRSGTEIALAPKTLKSLVDRYGSDNLQCFLKEIDLYGGNYKALTEPEARAIRRAPSLDKARNRILTARCQGRPRVVQEDIQNPKIPQIKSQKR